MRAYSGLVQVEASTVASARRVEARADGDSVFATADGGRDRLRLRRSGRGHTEGGAARPGPGHSAPE
ncbi:hypothetical protein LP52_04755 [Streptomonospora alba]|uniref:Uncharacterized protein n=1 Tax=Streptomonospora alba TaxID=183763 RepID=A0A0C2JSL2_9ACTN|nr:hypothetical protein [Streptomonospora alba]KIH99827.1 hypothetical protein LP52_04755 [Streptomonospora alba]